MLMKKFMNKIKTKMSSVAAYIGISLLAFSIATPTYAQALTRELQLGMTGGDISTLQTFLATDTSIYPQGLITGYFGSLTKAAVARFQSRNGISAVGRVGPITLSAINALLGNGTVGNGDKSGPIISNVMIMNNWNSGYWNQNQTNWTWTGTTDMSSSTWNNMYGTTYNTQTGAATPANYGQYAVALHWNTSEAASGLVYYSTSPLPMTETMNDAQIVGTTAFKDTSLKTVHDIILPNLQSNTTYYYVIYTRDASGNVSITWPSTFRTQ